MNFKACSLMLDSFISKYWSLICCYYINKESTFSKYSWNNPVNWNIGIIDPKIMRTEPLHGQRLIFEDFFIWIYMLIIHKEYNEGYKTFVSINIMIHKYDRIKKTYNNALCYNVNEFIMKIKVHEDHRTSAR